MSLAMKSLLAAFTLLSLAACASGPDVCPDGTHVGRFGHHCVVNR
ncbi:MAG: hypothetical protein ACR2F8_14395 [Caulobacteraceae bacterium]